MICGLMAGCAQQFVDALAESKTPLSANFQEIGSSCEVVVNFDSSVRGFPQSQPSFYRLENGGEALQVEPIPESLGVLVTFEDIVNEFDLIRFAAGTDLEELLPVTRLGFDTFPGGLLAAQFVADSPTSVVILTFDDAIDPESASDVTNFSLTTDLIHPTSSRVTGCGMQVELTFDALPVGASVEVIGLNDINGMPIANVASIAVREAIDDRTRPEAVSASYPSDGELAHVDIIFSEAVDMASAHNSGNYLLHTIGQAIDKTPLVANVIDGSRVRLTFDSLDPPASIAVTDVRDLAGHRMSDRSYFAIETSDDTTPPTVVSAAPGESTGMQVLHLTFSEGVSRTSAENLASYHLQDGDTVIYPNTVTIAEGGNAVDVAFEFLPVDATLIVSGLQDLNGNEMGAAETVTVDFTQASVPLGIASATYLPDVGTPIVQVSFNRPVDQETAEDPGNYRFSHDAAVSTALLQEDQRTVRVTVDTLGVADTITVTDVLDLFGNVMAPVVNSSITANGDSNPPSVEKAVFLANQDTPTAIVRFSEAVDRTAAERTTAYRLSGNNRGALTATVQSGGQEVLLEFETAALDDSIQFAGVTDLAGNLLDDSMILIAAAEEDTRSPRLETVQFLANQTTPTVALTFSEALNRTAVESVSLYTMDADDRVASNATLQDDGRTVHATFPQAQIDTTISVRSVSDLAGRVMTDVTNQAIDPASDNAAPIATSLTYAANATSPTVDVVFNEALDRPSAEIEESYAIAATGEKPSSATLQSDSRTVRLIFPSLGVGDLLSVANVKDFAGNQMNSTSFGVMENSETSPPTIASATRSGTKKIVIVFSEAVDRTTATTIANYNVEQSSVTITHATLENDGRSVSLTTTGPSLISGVKIDVSGVFDINGNEITAVDDFTTTG